MPKRILLECTPTYSTRLQTGIQRVVQKLVLNTSTTEQASQDPEVIPVIFRANKLFSFSPDELNENVGTDNNKNVSGFISSLLLSLNKQAFIIAIKDRLRGRLYPLLAFLKRSYLFITVFLNKSNSMNEIQVTHEDTIVFIDMSWGREIWKRVDEFQAIGAEVAFVLYDLIPLHPRKFYGEQNGKEFCQFMNLLLEKADAILCISESVKQELEAYIQNIENCQRKSGQRIDFFHLGADIQKHNADNVKTRPEIDKVFQTQEICFLIVSTIEPRKNHAYLLDVFDKLWQEGLPVRLIIAGRIGQLAEPLMARIKKHDELTQRLFVFHDLSDAELLYCYQHASALVFPSYAEGFGLPIIEAMQNKLPVIASDIPVHREIGKNKLMYIDPDKPESMQAHIETILKDGIPEQYTANDFVWINWKQASDVFLEKILERRR